MTYDIGRILGAPATACLQCPLCCNLVVEATTISECLHTFCRSCIYEKLSDGENDCCPICNVSLGCLPIDKLRPDRQLDEVRMKLFPLKPSKRRNEMESNVDIPTRRKERTLSSLGVGAAQPCGNPGYASRRTKAIYRKREADSKALQEAKDGLEESDSCSEGVNAANLRSGIVDRDEVNGKRSDIVFFRKRPLKEEDKKRLLKEEDKKRPLKEDEIKRPLKEEEIKRPLKEEEIKRPLKEEELSSPCLVSVRTPLPQSAPHDSLSMYLAERSKISAKSLLYSRPPVCKRDDDASPDNRGEDFRDLSTLADLAEIAIDHEADLESLPIRQNIMLPLAGSHPKRRRKKRGKPLVPVSVPVSVSVSVPTPTLTLTPVSVATSEPIPVPISVAASIPVAISVSEAQAKNSQLSPPDSPLPVRMLNGLNKLPVRRKSPIAVIKEAEDEVVKDVVEPPTGFWFALQASGNQAEENALPQISSRYIRIKDGNVPVAFVKKYLVKKLDLKSESEVEITCRGQPILPTLPLESIQGIWFATPPKPSKFTLKKHVTSLKNSGLAPGVTGKDCTMVLTYGRKQGLFNN